MHAPVLLSLLPVLAAVAADPEASPWPGVLDTRTIGAEAWRRANPERDGRGVAIAVLDTGVDMGVAGLAALPAGGPKVVEARDFTGEATVECSPVTAEPGEDGRPVWRARDLWVRGVDRVPGLPAGAPVFLGSLDETRFRNASVADLNGNGRADDRFAVLVFEGADREWRAVVDRAGDRDLAGDPVVRSYGKARESFTFLGGDPARGTTPVHAALTVEASADGPKKVEFHLPTGAHGTHVAGIAAGWRIDGKDGYDGIAPGAVVLSLKVGDNTLSGGASVTDSMRRAFEFAGRWSREHDVPVVANLSYGVGSEVEGRAEMERFLDRFCEENPRVVVVLSNGNGGPGLSTAGSPAAALHPVSVAAVLTPANARDLLGASLPGPRLFQFSARGGEVEKPDVAAPGIAAATVPYWAKGDVMRGTSMAAPQVTGAAALLLSGLPPKAAWGSGMVKRALKASATPLAGYGPLDQGAGVPDVGRAWDALSAALRDPDAAAVQGFEVSTAAPTGPGGRGRAAFWRAGGWAPTAARPAQVTVKPRFAAPASGAARTGFRRTFSLSADTGWVRLSKGSVYLKGEGEAQFDLWVEPKAVEAPGVHVATVTGRSDAGLAFSFPVTVVTPHRPRPVDGVPSVELRGLRLAPAEVARIPLRPPAGTTTVTVEVAAARGRNAEAYAYLYDGRGHRVAMASTMVASEKGAKAEATVPAGDLPEAGTLELDLYGVPTAREPTEVDVTVRFPALDAEPIRAFQTEPGLPPKARVDVVDLLDVPFAGRVSGEVAGCERTWTRGLGGGSMREGFHLSPEVESVEFEVSMSPEDFGRFTDVALTILDRDGKAVVRAGMDHRVQVVSWKNPDPGRAEADYTLEVRAGRAVSGGPDGQVTVAMRHRARERVTLAGAIGGAQRVELYPGVRATVEARASATPRACPSGSAWYGTLEFVSERDGATWLRLPLRVKP